MSEQYKIRSINDMVVTVDGGQGLSMQDMVYLGDETPDRRSGGRSTAKK